MDLNTILPYLIPVIVLQVALQLWCTVILLKPETQVRFNKKWLWAVIIWLFQTIGALVFLFAGRKED